MHEIKELSYIEFGILSPEDIFNMSSYEVTNSKKIQDNISNTVHDPRSGSLSNNCITCNQDTWTCPGHFGHIRLNMPVVHPLFYLHVTNLLKIFCYRCSELIISFDHLVINNIVNLKKDDKFNAILEVVKKCNTCFYCKANKRDYKIVISDNFIKNIYFYNLDDGGGTLFSPEKILNVFENIKDEWLTLLNISHPKYFVLTVFPVIPICCRPYMVSDGVINNDDLTYQLIEIVKNNQNIMLATGEKLIKHINNLKFRIETIINNSQSKATHATTGRPIKCLKERVAGKVGKEGRIRKNLLGKRCSWSGRTVVGPDSTIRFDEMIFPEYMAKVLTKPIIAAPFNLEYLQNIVNLNKAVRVERKGTVFNLFWKKITLQVGDVLHRHLMDGDIVFMNRQPTLHKSSMMAHKIKILPVKTFKISLAVTAAYNADFDGDEMNCHVPQTEESNAELKELAMPSHNIISPKSGKPNITIVQDVLTGAYLMTKEKWVQTLTIGQFNDILMKVIECDFPKRLIEIEKYISTKDGEKASVLNGRGLLSCIFPSDFYYRDNDILIEQGVLVEGVLTKTYLGSTEKSLIGVLHKEYGKNLCATFIDNIQFIVNNWLLISSFTIHAGDCLMKKTISDIIMSQLKEAEHISENHVSNKEMKIINCLSKAKDIGMKIAKDSLSEDNNFITTVESGSKGDYFNISQITGLLGQQNINGERIKYCMNSNTRSLPHYPLGSLSLTDKYESRGFISSSFTGGLNPKEFFFHSMSGRKGVIDTSLSTSVSGYNSRRMTKLCENIKIGYDGSVSDIDGRRYQYYYNDLGYDPTKLVKVGDSLEVCDISRLAFKLNKQYEAANREI